MRPQRPHHDKVERGKGQRGKDQPDHTGPRAGQQQQGAEAHVGERGEERT
jgi:hypothetical protein